MVVMSRLFVEIFPSLRFFYLKYDALVAQLRDNYHQESKLALEFTAVSLRRVA